MAVRQLNWATYMVDKDGKNKYFHDEVWLIDGYGDYIRHYLRAMAAAPELAPDNKDTLLRRSGLATLCSTARNGDAIGNQRHIYI